MARRPASDPTTRHPSQLLALAIGVVYTLIGILGFLVTGFENFASETDKTLLGFEINPLHNLVHLAIGLAGLIADGIFHLGSTAALGIGLVLLVQRWRTARGPLRQSAAGILLGAGGFNLYDGIIQHKLLGLHQVRAGAPNNLPYDLVFIGLAAVLLLAGLVLLRVAGSPSAAPSGNRS